MWSWYRIIILVNTLSKRFMRAFLHIIALFGVNCMDNVQRLVDFFVKERDSKA